MFGITEKELGFKIKEKNSPNSDSRISDINTKDQFSLTPKFEILSSDIQSLHSSLDSTALSSRLFNDASIHETSCLFKPNSSKNCEY